MDVSSFAGPLVSLSILSGQFAGQRAWRILCLSQAEGRYFLLLLLLLKLREWALEDEERLLLLEEDPADDSFFPLAEGKVNSSSDSLSLAESIVVEW